MVMVNENGELVGVDGQPIPQGQSLLENAIYQTMPEAGFNNGDMFREDTPQEVKDVISKEYKQRRDAILEQTALGVPQEIEASFGIPQIDKDARTSVQDAGLVDDVDLQDELVLFVPTTNKNVSKGTVAYNTPLGAVFLETPNGYVKLKNRLHTKKEATAIFDSILQLAKNMIDPAQGITSDSSVRILDFLRGVTYWGVPTDQQGNRKDAGNNSVFFEKIKVEDGYPITFTKIELVIGSEGKRFGFTPLELEANKDLVISALENIYNNVTAAKTKDINRSFEQITGISPEGGIESVTWPNYQSYLLSNKNPDGSTREDFELPIYTNMQPKEEGKFNRVGVYFYTTNTADEFLIPEPKAQAANIPIKQKTSFVLDGNTTNTYTSPQGKKILFRALPNATIDNYQETIQVLPGADLAEVVEEIQKSGKDYEQVIKQTIYNAIAPQLTKEKAQDAFEMEVTVGPPAAPAKPTQQTNEVEEKADIEKRRQ